MKIIDISKDYLEMFNTKTIIENILLENKIIEEPFDISGFISYINFGTHIYVIPEENKDAIIYSFKLINILDEQYLFITNTENIDFLPLFDKLKELNYSFDKLIKKDKYEIVEENIMNKPYFIINKEIYVE